MDVTEAGIFATIQCTMSPLTEPAGRTGSGSHVDHVVGRGDDLGVVLDDDDRVLARAEVPHDADEARAVARMEPDRRLVEDVQRADERRPERRREIDALRLAARERRRQAVEREVVEADVAQERKPPLNLLQHFVRDRLLFGTGESYSTKSPRKEIASVRHQMLTVFPQLSDLSIQYAWGGYIDITLNRAPDFGRLDDNIYYLQGFSGHGLALTGMAGKLVAETIAGQAERFDVFARIKHHAFPGGAWMRTPALMLGMLFFRLRDLL